ncbi:acidic mammalian chitinase-like [Gordionus sp. m RMFG-2023]|uniref:acidic mammalian chitinase-like n=1 Tax=Gordionus sp. m RMFG-2023 TaxID=3053472 RepID=UPI0031FC757C
MAQNETFNNTNHVSSKVIVGYIGSWNQYILDISDVNGNLYTHLVYNHVGIYRDGTIRFFYGDDFPKLEKLTTKYPHLKILISVGGKYNGFMFSQLTTDALQTFASNCKTLIQQYGLHGIDIAWENPIESEKARYENVLKILRQTLGPNAVITAKAPTSVKDFDGFDEVAMNKIITNVVTPENKTLKICNMNISERMR